VKAFAIDFSNPLVVSANRTATNPGSKFNGQGVIVIPNKHAVPNDGMNIHGIKERDLAHIDRKLWIVAQLVAAEPWEKRWLGRRFGEFQYTLTKKGPSFGYGIPLGLLSIHHDARE
jgi:hypothetical protein